MKNAIITGATGMVGRIVLQECLQSDEIGKVISISRRPTGKTDSKVQEIIHEDFQDFSSLEDLFQNIDILNILENE